MSRKVLLSIATVSIFLIADNNYDILQAFNLSAPEGYRYLTYVVLSLIIGLLGSVLLFGKTTLERLGLTKGFGRGMTYGLLFTLPMFIGYAWMGEWREGFNLYRLLTTFLGASMEEVVYRGLLFGFLYRFAGWKFIPAVLLNALIFGVAHLYQGSGLGESIGIFAVTLMGGCWFAWLYVKWDYNLWIAIGLHFFMNLSWAVFTISDNALGGWGANVFRIMTIALSVVYTLAILQQRESTQNSSYQQLQTEF